MAIIAKDKKKAKFLVRSVTPDARKMQEFCDTKTQVKNYLGTTHGRTEIVVWTRVPKKIFGI